MEKYIICASKYFINKQNVRSFTNIIKSNLLKSEDEILFSRNIFTDEEMVSDFTEDFKIILNKIKSNLRVASKQDFFMEREKRSEFLIPVDKRIILSECSKVTFEIIPKEFYGSSHNLKLMRKYLEIVVFTMKGEQVNLTNLLDKWNFTLLPWSNLINSRATLFDLLIWISKKVLTGIICLNFYVTTCKLSLDENKLYFFWKSDWHTFYDQSLNQMIGKNCLQKYDPYCCSKKKRFNLSNLQRLEIRHIQKSIPKLYLILKSNHDYRPIVKYKNEHTTNYIEKKRVKDRLELLRAIFFQNKNKLEQEYKNIHETWINLGKPKLYFVKSDLRNAFGSIGKSKLIKILMVEHLNYQKNEKNLNVKRKMAQVFKDFVLELKKPLLIRVGSMIYEWKRGLVQGYKYSPALSEIYYNYLDKVNFNNLLENSTAQIVFLSRVVDDYLFITDSLDEARNFLKCLKNFDNVNYAKTEVNFEYPGIVFNPQMSFLGYNYNTINLEVSRNCNVYNGQMCFKISFYNTQNLNKFLESRIGQSGVQISSHIFNFYYNTEESIWKEIFITFCISASKFCTILAILCEGKEMIKHLKLYKEKVTVKMSNAIIQCLKKNKSSDFVFRYCINHLRFLSWKALLLCAKRTSKCSGLVPRINDEMSKCNCIFGKWREHASRIDSDGKCTQNATKDVCKRLDLRVIMNGLEPVSSLFKFYNNRSKI